VNRLAGLLLVSSILSAPISAQNFTADFVETQQNGASGSGKVFASRDKVRLERDGMPAFVVDFAKQTSTMLMTDKHLFLSYPHNYGIVIPVWHFLDTNNICSEWESLQPRRFASFKFCQASGKETLDGRSLAKYSITTANGSVETIWVDPQLRIVLKRTAADGTIELKNIKESPQSPALFEIPTGYRKMEMSDMTDQ